jgi:hypothetical protein
VRKLLGDGGMEVHQGDVGADRPLQLGAEEPEEGGTDRVDSLDSATGEVETAGSDGHASKVTPKVAYRCGVNPVSQLELLRRVPPESERNGLCFE